MFVFKNKKKSSAKENSKNRVLGDTKPTLEDTKPTLEKTNNIYQSANRFGVKPEYFDYNKIELNKFLTNDEEYRKKVKDDDRYCSKKYSQELENVNCCIRKRYASDLNAFNDINIAINNSIEANSFASISSAKNSFFNSVDAAIDLEQKEKRIRQFYQKHPEHKYSDHLGLFPSDYDFISNNIRNQAYKINEQTKKMLLEQKTKILSLDNINDSMINSNIVSNYDTNFVHDTKSRYDFDVDKYNKHVGKVTPEFLMERSYLRTLGTTQMMNEQVDSNIKINDYNLRKIEERQNALKYQGRLKTDVPDVFEFMKEQEMKQIQKEIDNKNIDVIDLDNLTPYNIIKPDMRIRKSEKRNIL